LDFLSDSAFRIPHSALLLVLLLSACASAPQSSSPDQLIPGIAAPPEASGTGIETGSAAARFGLHFDPLAFTPPTVERADLSNGVSLHHYAEPEAPLVTVRVRIAVGSIDDPPGKVGAARMTAETIRNGGSVSLPGDDLDRVLDARGALLTVESDREQTWFRLSVLPEDLDWGLGILVDVLAHPALPADKLDEARGQAIVGLRQRMDVPREAARDLFPQLVFGKGNPWGWTETEATLSALTVDDLRKLYARFYRPSRMMIGISGDVTPDRARELAERHFGPALFPKEALAQPSAIPMVAPVARTRVYIVPKEATQNVIFFGHEGIDRFADDKFAVRLFNEVLSGGFGSRLLKEVRSERGLAYLVGGRIGEGTVRGTFYNVALTKTETTSETLDLMIGINRELQAVAPVPDEVEIARDAVVNSFVFLFDTAEQVLTQAMTLDYYGYPEDYLTTWVSNVRSVAPEEIRKAAETNLHLDRIVVLVYGAIDDALRAELEKLGPIAEIAEDQLRADWL
jgi:zinc protease